MELIKNLGTRVVSGRKQSFGIYKCPFCLQEVERRLGTERHTKSCGCKTKELISLATSGKNNANFGKKGELSPNWQNGKSFEEYGIEFNKELKRFILERDNYQCQNPNCEHKSKILHIHHIDYVKKNNFEYNLITLCNSCHVKTNGGRENWLNFYQNINKQYFLLFLGKFSINF